MINSESAVIDELTRKQREVLDYLRQHENRYPHPPTLDELCSSLGLKSRGSLHKHVQALVQAGLVEPMRGRQRGVRLTKKVRTTGRAPSNPATAQGSLTPSELSPRVPSQQESPGLTAAVSQMALFQLPMLGYIAAGRPIEAVAQPEHLAVPDVLHRGDNCYVLQVRGDSMIEAGILDGDWVVIEQRNHACDGEVVVDLIDGEEATLKRIEQKPDACVLHPANPTMAPLSYAPNRVQIQGVLVGQMRTYC